VPLITNQVKTTTSANFSPAFTVIFLVLSQASSKKSPTFSVLLTTKPDVAFHALTEVLAIQPIEVSKASPTLSVAFPSQSPNLSKA
jgi:hypothetical protein